MGFKRFCALAVAGAFWLSGAQAQAQEAAATPPPLGIPTAADFGALPFLTTPKLSPDGHKLVAQGLANGKEMVLIVDLVAAPENRVRRIPIPDKHQIDWVRWAGNDRVLVSLSRKDDLMGEEVRMTRIAMIDLAKHNTVFIGPREQGVDGDDVIFVDKTGKFLLLSTQPSIYEYPAVYRVDLDTGKSVKVVSAQERVWSWFADTDGVVRAGLGVDGPVWWVTYRANEGEPFKRVMRRNAFKDADNSKTTGIQNFLPVSGSDLGYAMAFNKQGRLALFHYDFKADTLGDLIYENPEYDIDDFSLDDEGRVESVIYTDDKAEVAWFDPELKKLQAKIDRALPGSINRVASMSADKNMMLVWSGAADDPGTYFLYDKLAKKMSPIAIPYESLRDKRLSPMASVKYKARDGLEIRAYLTLPPGKADAKGLPLVIMPHGGPFARDEWGYSDWVQFLASKGYAVLQPQYRGSTGFGRDFVEKGNGQFGRGMQDDVDDGVKWLASQGTVDAKRVCIMGASYGGYAAMLAAVRNPEIYRCAISFAGLSDVASQLRYDRSSFAAGRYFRDWRSRVQGDKDFNLDTVSPLKLADKMTVPILIAHGDDDDTVPLYQSRRLHEALLKRKFAHEYVVYPGEGHGFTDPVHSTDFLTRVGAFLDKYNPANP